MDKEAYRKRLWRAKHQAVKELTRQGYAVWSVYDPFWYATLVAISPTSGKAKIVRIATPESRLSEINRRKPGGNIPLEIWIRDIKTNEFKKLGGKNEKIGIFKAFESS